MLWFIHFPLPSFQAYIEGTLNEWTAAAVPMIRRTLTAFADGTTRGGSSSSSGSNNITSRSHHSLASALTSKDCSPRNRRSRSGGDDGADESRRPRHAGSQSGLWRVTNAARGGGEGGASDQAEGGQQLGQEGGGGGGGGGREGGEEGEETTAFRTRGDQISNSSSSNAKGGSRGSRLGPEDTEVEEARADFSELLRDAQEATGEGRGARPEGDIMEALLETSEGLVAAVEMQQKVSDARAESGMRHYKKNIATLGVRVVAE